MPHCRWEGWVLKIENNLSYASLTALTILNFNYKNLKVIK